MDHTDSRYVGYPAQTNYANPMSAHGLHSRAPQGIGVNVTGPNAQPMGRYTPAMGHPNAPNAGLASLSMGRGNMNVPMNTGVGMPNSLGMGVSNAPKYVQQGTQLPNAGSAAAMSNMRMNAARPGIPANMPMRSVQMSNMMPNSGVGMQSNYNPSNEILALLTKGSMPNLHGSQSGMINQNIDSNEVPFELSEFPALVRSDGGKEFSIQKEDFPALPTYKSASNDLQNQQDRLMMEQSMNPDLYQSHSSGYQSKGMMSHSQAPQTNFMGVPPSQVYPQQNLRSSGNYDYSQMHQQPMQILQPQSQLQQPQPQRGAPQPQIQSQPQSQPIPPGIAQAAQAPSAINPPQKYPPAKTQLPDRFGLYGLLSVIRMTDPDLNTLALGTDLTTLGLNLNSPDQLHTTFASPWADSPSRREPDFSLPACYHIQPGLQPEPMKFHMFSTDTLFYIFYSMPRDTLQIEAAIELYGRDWRFHKGLQRWLARAGPEAPVKTATFERGSFIFFEPTTWEKVKKDNFVLHYDQLEERAPTIPQQIPQMQGMMSNIPISAQ